VRAGVLSGARIVLAGVLCVAVVVGTQTIASAQPPAGAVRPQPAGAAAKGAWGPAGSSRDVAVAGYGDGAGYHVQVARESDNFAWRDVAVLRPAGLDESAWYGYQCLAGDGTHVAVTVLPGGLVNLQGARLRGAYGYSVDLTTGHVAALLSGVSFQYSSPGCGTGSLATFTSSLDDSESVTSLAVTSLAVVDLATGTVGQQSVVAGQVTSGLREVFRTALSADSYAARRVAYHSFSTSSGVRYPSAECRRL
jgi:hypothetical protein